MIQNRAERLFRLLIERGRAGVTLLSGKRYLQVNEFN